MTSLDNPTLTKNLNINFEYKNPLTSLSTQHQEIDLVQYEEQSLQFNFLPENATEKRFDWSVDKEGYIDFQQNVSFESFHGKVLTSHTLVGKKAGTVTLYLRPIDDTNSLETISIKVNVKPFVSQEEEGFIDTLLETKKQDQNLLTKMPMALYGSEWSLFTLLRMNQSVSLDAYLTNVNETLNMNQLDPTDYARIALVLGAAGLDARHLGKHNIIEKLTHNQNIAQYPSNHVIWTLIALDTKAYNIEKDAAITRISLLESILSYQQEDGSFSLSHSQTKGGIDLSAMALQSLAPYYALSLRKEVAAQIPQDLLEKVNVSVNKALHYLSQQMQNSGGYLEGGIENSNSVAQVITALTMLNMDPLKDPNFIRGNNNMLKNLLSYRIEGGYAFQKGQKANDMATIQVLYALESYERFLLGKKNLYDFTDKEAQIPSISQKQYAFIKNQDLKFAKNQAPSLQIQFENKLSDLVSVSINGVKLDAYDYELDHVLNLISIKDSVLNTLSIGTHQLVFLFSDGKLSTSFSIFALRKNESIYVPLNNTQTHLANESLQMNPQTAPLNPKEEPKSTEKTPVPSLTITSQKRSMIFPLSMSVVIILLFISIFKKEGIHDQKN